MTRLLLSTVLFCFLLVPAAAAQARMIDLAKFKMSIDIEGDAAACQKLAEWEDRIICYSDLCEPGYECAESILAIATADAGPVTGTRVLDDFLVDPKIFNTITDGHELSHIVGRTTAKIFGVNGDAFSLCPPDYLYGCQHGFFEQALAEHDGPTRDLATQICESIQKEPLTRERFYCYHGVGHGVMMAKNNDIYETIRICDSLPYVNASRGCWQGAFMENINAQSLGIAREGVFLEDDLLSPCNKIPVKYQWECYENHAAYLMWATEHDIVASGEACLGADERTMPACILSLAQLTTNPGWQNITLEYHPEYDTEGGFLEDAVALCALFPEQTHRQCYQSAMDNLLNYDQYEEAVTFCDLIPEDQKADCFQRMGNELRWRGKTEEQIAAYCSNAPEQYRENCLTYKEIAVYHPVKFVEDEFAWDDPSASNLTLEKNDDGGGGGFFSWLFGLFGSSNDEEVTELPSLNSGEAGNGSVVPAASVSNGIISNTVIRLKSSTEWSPPEVTIAPGETVTWINDTTGLFWPASDVHPTHQLLPAFDAKKPLKAENAYSFTFTEPGDWTFHDHMSPNATGVVHVVAE